MLRVGRSRREWLSGGGRISTRGTNFPHARRSRQSKGFRLLAPGLAVTPNYRHKIWGCSLRCNNEILPEVSCNRTPNPLEREIPRVSPTARRQEPASAHRRSVARLTSSRNARACAIAARWLLQLIEQGREVTQPSIT